VEDTKGLACLVKIRWVQGEIQMQWRLIEREKETGHVMYMGSGAIRPKIVGKDRRRAR